MATGDDEVRLRLTASAEVIWQWDPVSDRIWWSDRMEPILGWPRERLASGALRLELVHPDDRGRVDETLSRLRRGETNGWAGGYRLRRPDQSYGEVLERATALRSDCHECGGRVSVIGTLLDLDAWRAADRRLRLGEERYRTLFMSLPFPVYAWRFLGDDFTLVDYNDAALVETEGQVASLVGVRATRWYADQPGIREALRHCLDRRQPIRERRRYRYRTLPREALLDIVYAYVPPDTVLVHTVDATQRASAEEALRASESRYRTLIEVLNEGVVLFDAEGVARDCNPAILHLLGEGRNALLGTAGDDPRRRWVHGDGRPCRPADSPVQQTLRSGRPRANALRGTRTADGKRLWLSVSSGVVRDEQTGEVAGVVCSYADVTALKQAEDSLRDLTVRLMRTRDEEGRRIARDLHDSTAQGLAAAAMSLEVLARSLEAPTPAAARALEECRTLIEQCGREVRTLSYLLHPPLLEEAGLRSALGVFCDGLATRSGVTTTLEVAANLGRLPREVELAAFRIAQESVGNALRHGQARNVVVRLARLAEELELEVADDGCGRASPAGGRHGESSPAVGVGIAGMRERARLLGGRLTVEIGATGTTVRASLPLVQERR